MIRNILGAVCLSGHGLVASTDHDCSIYYSCDVTADGFVESNRKKCDQGEFFNSKQRSCQQCLRETFEECCEGKHIVLIGEIPGIFFEFLPEMKL